MIKNVEITIQGMTCGGCSSRIEKFIGATEGVQHSAVNLIANKGYFRIDESKLSTDDLCTKIQNMGFPCAVDVSLYDSDTAGQCSCITSLYAKFVPLISDTADCLNKIKDLASKNNISLQISKSTSKKGFARFMTITFDAQQIQIQPIFELMREYLVSDRGVDLVCTDKESELLLDEEWIMRRDKRRALFYVGAAAAAMLMGNIPGSMTNYLIPVLCTSVFADWVYSHAHKITRIRDAPMEIFVFFNATTCFVLGIILTSLELVMRSNTIHTLLRSGNLTNALLLNIPTLPASHGFARATIMLLTIHTVGHYLRSRCKYHANTNVSRLSRRKGDRLVRTATAILPVPTHGVTPSQMILFDVWDSEVSALVKDHNPRKDLIGLHHSSRASGEPVLVQSCWRQKELVDIGDIVIVCSGETLPCDGILLSTSGSSAVANLDESVLTGECEMVPKVFGHSVYEGSVIDVGGSERKALAILVTKVGSGTRLGQIEAAVKSGAFANADTTQFVSKFVRRFLVCVCVIAVLTWAYWTIEVISGKLSVPDIYGSQTTFNKISFILQFGAAVIAMACPCAIGLAIPVAVAVTSSTASLQGMILRDSSALWRGAKIDTVILDKTGTLTKGLPIVSRVNLNPSKLEQLGISEDPMCTFASIVTKMESRSSTKHAYAILRFIDHNLQKIESMEIRSLTEKIGQGMETICVTAAGKEFVFYLGSKSFIKEYLRLHDKEFDITGSIFLATPELGILATVGIAHRLDPNALRVVAELQTSHEVWLCSGDSQANSIECATSVGIPTDHVISAASPWDKERLVKTLTEQGQNVAVIGDGINDSLAMSAARLGIAFGFNSDLLTNAAQIVIYRQNLEAVTEILKICRKANFLVKLNLTWAVTFNCLGIPIAAGFFYPKIWISSVQAAFCMALSSLLVLISSIITMRPSKPKSKSIATASPLSARPELLTDASLLRTITITEKSFDQSQMMRLSTTEKSCSNAFSENDSSNCDINLRQSAPESNVPSSWFSQTV